MKTFLSFVMAVFATIPLHSQSVFTNTAGQVDPSYILQSPTLSSAPTQVRVKTDGTAYVTGLGPGVYRILPDGTNDAKWVMGTGANNTVRDVRELPDGKVLIVGSFTSVSGHGSRYLARLNSNGSVDTGFNMGTAINGLVNTLHIQSDGKILIAGQFTLVHGVSRVGIARLNSDGSLDATFNPGTGAAGAVGGGNVAKIYPAPGGKYIIGGLFNNYNGSGKGSLVRILNDGSFDTSWILENNFMTIPYALVWQPDGKMLLAYSGDAKMVRRLNADGSLDPSFETTFINGTVEVMALQADGKVVIGGAFTSINFVSRARFTRLNSDGTLDTEYVNSGGVSAVVSSMGVLPNGDMIIGGNFTSVQGQPRGRLAKLFGEAPAVVSIEREEIGLTESIALMGNYPNPFNPSTIIRFQLSDVSETRLAIYDLLGREIAVLVDGVRAAGDHQVRFDAGSLASGIYLIRLEAAGQTLSRRMTLVK